MQIRGTALNGVVEKRPTVKSGLQGSIEATSYIA